MMNKERSLIMHEKVIQCSFLKDTGNRNVLFVVKILSQREIERGRER